MGTKPYAALVLSDESRQKLLEHFPPRFSETRMHHITIAHGTRDESALFTPRSVQIVGYACHDGVEALAVEVNGTSARPGGGAWHITISFAEGNNAAMSNELILGALSRSNRDTQLQLINPPIAVEVTPQIVEPTQPAPENQPRADNRGGEGNNPGL